MTIPAPKVHFPLNWGNPDMLRAQAIAYMEQEHPLLVIYPDSFTMQHPMDADHAVLRTCKFALRSLPRNLWTVMDVDHPRAETNRQLNDPDPNCISAGQGWLLNEEVEPSETQQLGNWYDNAGRLEGETQEITVDFTRDSPIVIRYHVALTCYRKGEF